MKIAVLGDGGMGTAMALVLAAKPEHTVHLWSARAENGQLLRQFRENTKYLKGIPIPESVALTTDLPSAIQAAELLILAIPTVYLRETLSQHQAVLRSTSIPIVSVAKGLEIGTSLRPTQIALEVLGKREAAALSGPGHAEEIARNQPTSLVVASDSPNLARLAQDCFHSNYLRVYTSDDLLGVELAGALKNVIGIAAGIGDGLGFGDNAKSALLTRSLVELLNYSKALGAQPSTLFGLAGIGDLITTSVSQHGRNRALGERIGNGEKLSDILSSSSKVAEGVYTAKSVHDDCSKRGIIMPICEAVYRILYENKPPALAVRELMQRDKRSETIASLS